MAGERCRFQHRAGSAVADGLRPGSRRMLRLRARDTGRGRTVGLAVRRGGEPARRTRRVRDAGRRRLPDRLGGDEPGRRDDDPGRADVARPRRARPVHAGVAGSRRRGAADRLPVCWHASGRACPSPRSPAAGAALPAAGAARRRAAAGHRLRCQARPAAILRVVPGRLRRRQRRFRRDPVRRGAERRVLRAQPRPARLAAGHAAGRRYGLGIFIVIVGVLSAILAVLYAFQQDDWRWPAGFSSAENAAIAVTCAGCGTDVPAERQLPRSGRSRLDRCAAAPGRARAGQGRPVPCRRRRLRGHRRLPDPPFAARPAFLVGVRCRARCSRR